MEKEFYKFLYHTLNLKKNTPVLLAVSGGVDSMVMLHLFLIKHSNISVAHANFQLRGLDSMADEDLVKEYCLKHSIPFFCKKFDTLQYAQKNKLSVQMAARDLRYNWFKELCLQNHFSYTAVATNKDDNLETFFINILRGTGLEGMSGIKEKNLDVIRPLLFAHKKRIYQYAQQHNVPFREDISNTKLDYVRNRIRLNVVPELLAIQADLHDKLDNLQYILNEHSQIFKEYVQAEKIKRFTQIDQHTNSIQITDKFGVEIKEIVLFELLKPYNFEYKQVFKIFNNKYNIGKKYISPSHILWIDRNQYIIQSITEKLPEKIFYIQQSDIPIQILYPYRMNISIIKHDTPKDLKNINHAYLNLNNIEFPLVFRLWKPGDVMIPFGMKGNKKISDILIDSKIPSYQKKNQWVLASNNHIVWLVGKTIHNSYRIDSNTQNILRIIVE